MVPAAYYNFDLLITRSEAMYRAFVVDAPGGDADVTFALPFTQDELNFLAGLSGLRRGGTGERSPGQALDLKELGTRLFGAIFQDKVAAVLTASQAQAEQEQAGLRLRLRFSPETAELATLPWEILYDPVQERFLALSESSPILRYLSLPKARPTLLVAPPLRVLALLASPPGYDALDLEREWQVLEAALAELVDDGTFVLERLAQPTLDVLQTRLLGEAVHILHFVGHGVFDEEAGAGALVLADENGDAQEVPGEELATLLHNHSALRLVYLNACEGALSSHLTVFSGVAQTLVQQGVPAAVAMQAEITDEAAIELSCSFYTALAKGYPVDATLTQARVTVARRSAEWAVPVLFSRSPDNRLFDVVDVLPEPACPYPGMVPFSEAQADVFFGREREIEEAVNCLAQHPFLAVIGPSGSGKSSLVHAGVIPALRRSKRFGEGEWTVHTMRPSDRRTPDGLAAPMQALRELLQLPRHASMSGDQSPNLRSPTLLVIDQFEEIFTLADPDEAQAFQDALEKLIGHPNLHIVLTVRADFYPDLMACDLWPSIRANRLELPPLSEEELWAAIVQPAAQVGVTVEDALAVQLIADAAGEAGVLPLVQETLVLLWEKVERRQLKLAHYREMAEGGHSGLQVAIDRRATTVYNNLPEVAQPMARRIFLRLVQFGEGRADTRRQQTVAELRSSGDDPVLFDEALRTLVDARLLTTSGEAGDPQRRVDIAHEALISGWGLLRGWIQEKREAERTRRRLEEKATEWLRLNRSGALLDSYEVIEAESWMAETDADELGYSQDLLDLVRASRAAIEQAELKAQEQIQREARARRRVRALVVGTVALLAVTILIGWFWRQANLSAGQARTAQATAQAAATQEAKQRLTAEEARMEAETQARLAAQAEATAIAARAEVERLSQRIRADQLATHALNVLDEKLPLASLLAVEGLVASTSVEPSVFNVAREVLRRVEGRVLVGDTGQVLAFSPDARYVASGYTDSTVRVWDLETPGAAAYVLSCGWNAPVRVLAFSPDSRYLASGVDDTSICVWDTEHLEEEPSILLGHQVWVDALAFSPDARWLASGSIDGAVLLWNMTNIDGPPKQLRGHSGGVRVITFSPDGRYLASGSGDSTVRVWDTADLDADAWTLRGHKGAVTALSFTPNGGYLASGSDDATVRLWDMEDIEAEPRVLRGHRKAVTALVFSPDGHLLASGAQDATVQVWDTADLGADPRVLRGPGQGVTALVFSPDGHYLAGGSVDAIVRVWSMTGSDADSRTLRGHEHWITNLGFSPDGRFLLSGGDDSVRLWDMENPEVEPQVLRGHRKAVTTLAFSPDGHLLASGSQDATVRVWEMTAPKAKLQALRRLKDSITALRFSPDGRSLASGSWDAEVRVWDVTDLGADPLILRGHRGGITVLAFSPDGRFLASGSQDATVRVWNMADLKAMPSVLQGYQDAVTALEFSPDSRFLASGSYDNTVHVWDMSNPDADPWALRGYDEGVTILAFSPDGRYLASGSWDSALEDGMVRIWTMKNLGAEPWLLAGHKQEITALVFSSDGRYLASGSLDATIRVWNMAELDAGPWILRGHETQITALAFSPDSRYLASGSEDDTIRIWDMNNPGADAWILRGHDRGITTLAFSPDGRFLASGSRDATVRLWRWRVEDTVDLLCQAAGRNLSQQEWIHYLPGQEYRKTCPQWPEHLSVVQALDQN